MKRQRSAAFATYAVGFLVRPFGAVFFGRLGDLTDGNILS